MGTSRLRTLVFLLLLVPFFLLRNKMKMLLFLWALLQLNYTFFLYMWDFLNINTHIVNWKIKRLYTHHHIIKKIYYCVLKNVVFFKNGLFSITWLTVWNLRRKYLHDTVIQDRRCYQKHILTSLRLRIWVCCVWSYSSIQMKHQKGQTNFIFVFVWQIYKFNNKDI